MSERITTLSSAANNAIIPHCGIALMTGKKIITKDGYIIYTTLTDRYTSSDMSATKLTCGTASWLPLILTINKEIWQFI